MMLFIFARHMFMHFHALHVLVPSFLYLNFFVVFLFFSLSLSFSILIMAPKMSVHSKNPIRRGSSSSYFPLNSIQFHNEKARADFSKNFTNQAIHLEHQFILSNFPDTPLPGAMRFPNTSSFGTQCGMNRVKC